MDGTLPHFQLGLDRFSYADFDHLSSKTSEIKNKQHKEEIKTEKYRKCKSQTPERLYIRDEYHIDDGQSEEDTNDIN